MKALIVCKSGSVFGTSSPNGEVGETAGILDHLRDRYPKMRLIYFGHHTNQAIARHPGWTFVKPQTEDVTENSPSSVQFKGFILDKEIMQSVLGTAEPLCLLNISGYTPTMSWLGNPKKTIVQLQSVKYQAPMLALLQNLQLRRVVINNDPRTYPKDQEMSLGWDYARPAALLDQCSWNVYQVVGGIRYRR